MDREFVQAVIDAGESGVQGVDADMQCTLPAVSAPLWKYEFAAAGDFAQGFKPFDHRWRQRDPKGPPSLGAFGRQPPHWTQIRCAIEIELAPLRTQQFAFAHTEGKQQFDGEQIGAAETR